MGVISCAFKYLHFGERKAEGRREIKVESEKVFLINRQIFEPLKSNF